MTGTPRASAERPAVPGATDPGRHSSGTPKQRRRARVPVAAGEVHAAPVREAVAQSVTNRPSGRSRKKASRRAEPQCARPSAQAAAAGTLAQHPGELGGREIGVERQAARAWVSASAPSALEPLGLGTVRASCQTIDRADRACPSRASQPRQLSPWFVDRQSRSTVDAAASRQARTSARSSSGSCSTQPGGGWMLAMATRRTARTPRRGSSRRPRVLVVPWSMARTALMTLSLEGVKRSRSGVLPPPRGRGREDAASRAAQARAASPQTVSAVHPRPSRPRAGRGAH